MAWFFWPLEKVLCRIEWISAGKTVHFLPISLRWLIIGIVFLWDFLLRKLFVCYNELTSFLKLVRRLFATLTDKLRTGDTIFLILMLTRWMGGKEMFPAFFTRIRRAVLAGLYLFEAVKMLLIRSVINPLLMFLHEGRRGDMEECNKKLEIRILCKCLIDCNRWFRLN